jgi:hypothetical protein
VIEDVASWIRSNGNEATASAFHLAAKPRPAFQDFVRRWSIPALASIAMTVSFVWLTLDRIHKASGVKYDLASDVTSIQQSAAPVLKIDQTFASKKGRYSDYPPDVLDTSFRVPLGGTCVVEGEATLTNWRTDLEINVHGRRPLTAAEETEASYAHSVLVGGHRFFDSYQGNIWYWTSSHGKIVHFRLRFHNELSAPTAWLEMRVWNMSDDAARLAIVMYAKCSKPK